MKNNKTDDKIEMKLFIPKWMHDEFKYLYEKECEGGAFKGLPRPGFRHYIIWKLMDGAGFDAYTLEYKGLKGLVDHDISK